MNTPDVVAVPKVFDLGDPDFISACAAVRPKEPPPAAHSPLDPIMAMVFGAGVAAGLILGAWK